LRAPRFVRDLAVVVGPLARAKEFDAGTAVYVKGMTANQIRAALNLPPKS